VVWTYLLCSPVDHDTQTYSLSITTDISEAYNSMKKNWQVALESAEQDLEESAVSPHDSDHNAPGDERTSGSYLTKLHDRKYRIGIFIKSVLTS
jgi:mRNA-degrading endonuclease RelE of RelBE toxin-antitoxin system